MKLISKVGRTLRAAARRRALVRGSIMGDFARALWYCGGFFTMLCAASVHGGDVSRPPGDAKEVSGRLWQGTTEAYRQAALGVLLDEAALVARDLHLPEKLPIGRADLPEFWINPPGLSDDSGLLGTLSTTNYRYFASAGCKLSRVERNRQSSVLGSEYFASLKDRFSAPKGRMDTNLAYRVATQWLAAFNADVASLERDSSVHVTAWQDGDKFVPIYRVCWERPRTVRNSPSDPGKDDFHMCAVVQFVEPERRLLELEVGDSQYLRRRALAVPERERLLQQSDDPLMQEMWRTTQAYKDAVLKILVEEANVASCALGLAEKVPIRASDLSDVRIETPLVADRTGRAGSVATPAYWYCALSGGKLSIVEKNLGTYGEGTYLAALKAKGTLPRSQVNTNLGYELAARYLNAFSVDVEALERDFKPRVSPWYLGDRFVPYYTVEWTRARARGGEVAATVELFEPERALKLLWVHDPVYLKRKPVLVPDQKRLLQ